MLGCEGPPTVIHFTEDMIIALLWRPAPPAKAPTCGQPCFCNCVCQLHAARMRQCRLPLANRPLSSAASDDCSLLAVVLHICPCRKPPEPPHLGFEALNAFPTHRRLSRLFRQAGSVNPCYGTTPKSMTCHRQAYTTSPRPASSTWAAGGTPGPLDDDSGLGLRLSQSL